MAFMGYHEHSKGYVGCVEHPNGGVMEVDSYNVDFLKDEFPSIGKIKKDVQLFELHHDN